MFLVEFRFFIRDGVVFLSFVFGYWIFENRKIVREDEDLLIL